MDAMDWQASEDTVPSARLEADARLCAPARPRAAHGATATRRRSPVRAAGRFPHRERRGLPFARLAYETWGELNSDATTPS
jgi:homoserine O-acetyltransferase